MFLIIVEFMRLLARSEVVESEQPLVTRFIDGPNNDIILEMGVTPVFSLSKAQSLALRAESRAYCRSNVRADSEYRRMQSVNTRSKHLQVEGDKSVNSEATETDLIRKGVVGANNPYAKPRGDLCWRCEQTGHISTQCPKR